MTGTQPIHIDTEIRDDVAILTVRGNLIARPNVAPFHTHIQQLVKIGATEIVVDFSNIKWFGAAMLGELVVGLETLRNAGCDMRLARVAKTIDTVTHLIGTFKTLDTVDQAVTNIHRKVLKNAALAVPFRPQAKGRKITLAGLWSWQLESAFSR